MTTRVTRALALVAVLAAATSCTNQLQGNSSSYLIIDSLEGASGAKPADLGETLSSDVQTMVKVTIDGKETQVPTIFADNGMVKFTLALKSPGGSGDSATKPSSMNFVTLTRYQVAFSRTDGRNTPGVDVPYGFDGAMTITVTDSGGAGNFTIVRIQAKEEAPLKALVNGGGAYTISTIASVTFFGTDQAGRQVNVTGHISVNFADWGDPQ